VALPGHAPVNGYAGTVSDTGATAMGGGTFGLVSAFSLLPVHPANMKANSRAMILIRAIYPSSGSLVGFFGPGGGPAH
jgi:hypothetical protein